MTRTFAVGSVAAVVLVMIQTEVVEVARLARVLAKDPALAAMLFTSTELQKADGKQRNTASLAARLAAKRAVVRLLGDDPRYFGCCEVTTARGGRPVLSVAGLEAIRWHLSISHEELIAVAAVLAEVSYGECCPRPPSVVIDGNQPGMMGA
jgi:phosphopantetheine--protein transferase-like protein